MSRMILTVLAAVLCSGCSILPETVDVAYQTDLSVPRIPIVAAGPVQVAVVDGRHAEAPAWIADKKNGYGMRLANVYAQQPVADLAKAALIEELRARGVPVGEGSTTIAVEITRLESVYQNRFFSIGAIGYGDWAVQVRRADGMILYARNLTVQNDEEAGLAGTAGQAGRSVEVVLSNIVGQLMADPLFTKALGSQTRTS